MSDSKLRELERRWRETKSVDDEAAYLRERVRVGDLTQERLELAAYCGHEGARRVTGFPMAQPEWAECCAALAKRLVDQAASLRRGPLSAFAAGGSKSEANQLLRKAYESLSGLEEDEQHCAWVMIHAAGAHLSESTSALRRAVEELGKCVARRIVEKTISETLLGYGQ